MGVQGSRQTRCPFSLLDWTTEGMSRNENRQKQTERQTDTRSAGSSRQVAKNAAKRGIPRPPLAPPHALLGASIRGRAAAISRTERGKDREPKRVKIANRSRTETGKDREGNDAKPPPLVGPRNAVPPGERMPAPPPPARLRPPPPGSQTCTIDRSADRPHSEPTVGAASSSGSAAVDSSSLLAPSPPSLASAFETVTATG